MYARLLPRFGPGFAGFGRAVARPASSHARFLATTPIASSAAAPKTPIGGKSTGTAAPPAALPSLTTSTTLLTLSWPQSPAPTSFHYIWLRDHCQCAQCVHPDNRQKLHSSADVPHDLKPASVKLVQSPAPALEIVWENKPLLGRPDGSQSPHVSVFDLDWLQQQDYSPASVVARDRKSMHIVPWDRQALEKDPVGALWLDYEEFMKTDEGRRRGLKQVYLYGLAFIRNVPLDERAVEWICERLGGHVQETFYGKTFDVKSIPKANNIAYTSLFLGLHMDIMYFEAPPGLQLLHSLQNTVTGGASFFADSFAAANRLRAAHPSDFNTLCEVPVTFHYDNNGHHLRFRHPTISDYDGNEPMRVYYAPPFQGPLECPPEKIEDWYRAFARFRDEVENPEMVYTHRLEPGECVIFNNRRVLHARDQFDPLSGDRFLKGAYIMWDAFKDKHRVHVAKKEA